MARAGQTGVFEDSPNRQTPQFAERAINLSALAREIGVTPSHLSRVFSGRCKPSLTVTRSLSRCLGLSVDGFLTALDAHIYKVALVSGVPPTDPLVQSGPASCNSTSVEV
jgi:transcriptional regulator with XRE-family HTH domain